jgi:RNA polymerase-binding transcription factor DksA
MLLWKCNMVHRSCYQGKPDMSQYKIFQLVLGISRHAGDDNIKRNLRETECEDINWIHQALKRDHTGSCEHSNEPLGSTKCEFLH